MLKKQVPDLKDSIDVSKEPGRHTMLTGMHSECTLHAMSLLLIIIIFKNPRATLSLAATCL